MKLYVFPPSTRVLGIVALKNHLALDCEIRSIDLGRGDQLTPEYLALNPNKKMPLAWKSAHWDAESVGMVAYEKTSKAVLGLGPPDPAFIARGEQNFARFAAVLNTALRGKTWLIGEQLTIADFSIGAQIPSAERMGLPVGKFSEILRWYEGLAALPGWRKALATKDAAMAAWQAQRSG